MIWKCNTFDCQHVFEDNTTEEDIEKEEVINMIGGEDDG